jgi:integrase
MNNKDKKSAKRLLPLTIERQLRKGESIFHSGATNHVSRRFPEGKWVAQVRRTLDCGRKIKFPVRAFGTAVEALAYVKSLRPDAAGKVIAAAQGEETVRDLHLWVSTHRWRRRAATTRSNRQARWKNHLEEYWGGWKISQVTSRAAQEWLTELELRVETGKTSFGLSTVEECRIDMHSLFEDLRHFSDTFSEKRNPFVGLEHDRAPARSKVTIESSGFGPLVWTVQELAANGLATRWICEMFCVSLLTGLRRGECLALCRDQIDLCARTIRVDRALRCRSRELNLSSRREEGPVLRQAISYPKGGSASDPKDRIVPIPDQLVPILESILSREPCGGKWDLLWSCSSGTPLSKEQCVKAFHNLKLRLIEISQLAPLNHDGGEPWPPYPCRRGWKRNGLVEAARQNPVLRLFSLIGKIEFRDTRNSFNSYAAEVGLGQSERDAIMGHSQKGVGNQHYYVVTSTAFSRMQKALSEGWSSFKLP